MEHDATDWLDEIVALVNGLNARFPTHAGVFHQVSRLAEETGELAQQVNCMEGMGIKHAKNGPPRREDVAKEVLDVVKSAVAIAAFYDVLPEVRSLTMRKVAAYRADGWI
ncbi:hypothetical protein [Pilimelia columellifera]|uniref:NTP pyrophosphohydrolase MazG putative catalytic core domain-containing protein n=1 Tax=Pilimelia columellifera subsp. columellifera TaxID=706583 RepID=A0ABP6B150_9ACTN